MDKETKILHEIECGNMAYKAFVVYEKRQGKIELVFIVK